MLVGDGLLILALAVMIALTMAVAAYKLAPRLSPPRVPHVPPIIQSPDTPRPFGYDMAWLAVRTRDADSVVAALGLLDAEACSWSSGITAVYDQGLEQTHVFVSPPVNGWTFVVGLPLPHPTTGAFVDKCSPLLVSMGGAFAEVQYFFSYVPIDMFAWARMVDGRLLRAFAAGDEGVLWNKGKRSREERRLGLKLFELRGVRGRQGDAGGDIVLHPTEDHVMRLASRWSLDPTRLHSASAPPGLGYIALAPQSWRPERANSGGRSGRPRTPKPRSPEGSQTGTSSGARRA